LTHTFIYQDKSHGHIFSLPSPPFQLRTVQLYSYNVFATKLFFKKTWHSPVYPMYKAPSSPSPSNAARLFLRHKLCCLIVQATANEAVHTKISAHIIASKLTTQNNRTTPDTAICIDYK
ncbi:unnamed protein product, partial [Ectocarpus fasciculatus]